MNASVLHAQRTLQEPESALLTGKHLGGCCNGNGSPATSSSSQKRGGTVLPSIERERCLSCNSTIRDTGGPVINKNPIQMAPVYGGGFAMPGPASVDKNGSIRASNSTSGSRSVLSPRTPLGGGPIHSRSSLTESASEGCADIYCCYYSDQLFNVCVQPGFCWELMATCIRGTPNLLHNSYKTARHLHLYCLLQQHLYHEQAQRTNSHKLLPHSEKSTAPIKKAATSEHNS